MDTTETTQARDGPTKTLSRHQNKGLRKICGCPRRTWAKCPHPWHFNFKWDGQSYRFSLDKEVGRRLRDKGEAEREADAIRVAIRNRAFRATPAPQPTTPAGLTFAEFGAKFVKGYSQETRHKTTWANDEGEIGRMSAFPLDSPTGPLTLGKKSIGAITDDDLEAVLADLHAKGRAGSTRNKYLQTLKAMGKWGQKKGYLTRRWLADSDVKREKRVQRNRRLAPGEEEQLIAAANLRLQRLIIGALETGARLGELLALQWREVDLKRGEIRLLAATTKDREDRVLPISARLKAVLTIAQLDPDGKELPATAHVFGDEMGGKIASIVTAWETCVLKAHGEKVGRTKKKHALTADSQAALKRIDPHFHDLRHEAGSRFLEAGWPLHHVKDMLGHADIKTTDTYLNVTRFGLAESMKKLDEARTRCKDAARSADLEQPLPCNADQPDERKAVVH